MQRLCDSLQVNLYQSHHKYLTFLFPTDSLERDKTSLICSPITDINTVFFTVWSVINISRRFYCYIIEYHYHPKSRFIWRIWLGFKQTPRLLFKRKREITTRPVKLARQTIYYVIYIAYEKCVFILFVVMGITMQLQPWKDMVH